MFCREIFEDNNIEIIGTSEKGVDCNGTQFVTVTSGGIKKEGEAFSAIFASPEEAIKRFTEELLVWLDGRKKIYIRKQPELKSHTFFNKIFDSYEPCEWFVVTARLTAY